VRQHRIARRKQVVCNPLLLGREGWLELLAGVVEIRTDEK